PPLKVRKQFALYWHSEDGVLDPPAYKLYPPTWMHTIAIVPNPLPSLNKSSVQRPYTRQTFANQKVTQRKFFANPPGYVEMLYGNSIVPGNKIHQIAIP